MANNQTISGIWTWLGVVGFIILLMVSAAVIYPARLQYERQKEFYERTKAEADRVRAERDALQKEVSALQSSPTAIEKVARENYRLCKEGEIVMYYKKPQK
ncbi:MAG: septum formation initiator family protein [Lentisphaeria bacterium]|nr:septum formation initiator family protein [Lentisphaeria bacterium]